MSLEKRCSRTRKKNHLLKCRLDFRVPDTRLDPSRSKNIPKANIREEQILPMEDDESEEKEEFVHDDWEDRVDEDADPKSGEVRRSNFNDDQSALLRRSRGGRTYPYDLWSLLGNYIHPESVQTFGLLCRGSWEVLKTFKFWSALYERTFAECKRTNCLGQWEDQLKVSLVVRPFQVKYHVVRALFTIYPPFKDALDRQKLNSVDLDQLKGYRPALCWRRFDECPHEPKEGVFFHNLLLKRGQRYSAVRVDKTVLFNEMSEAVSYNPVQDSIVLQIVTDYPSKDLDSIMGMQLINAKYNTSRDMRNMRLELDMSMENFYPPRLDSKLTIDPVKRVRILPWWHPRFPILESARINEENSIISETWDS